MADVEQRQQGAAVTPRSGGQQSGVGAASAPLRAVGYEQGAALVSPGNGMGGDWMANLPGPLGQLAKKPAAQPAPKACLLEPAGASKPAPGGATSAPQATVPQGAQSQAPQAPAPGAMPSDPKTGWGAVLGDVHGVEVRRNLVSDLAALKANVSGISTGDKAYLTTLRTTYGYSYQCVELVNRYFAQALGHQNMIGTGNAKAYLGEGDRGLETHKSGGPARPQPGDLMVDLDGGGGFGHVGIAKSATDSEVVVAQQNTPNAFETTAITKTDAGWKLGKWDGFRRKPGAAPPAAQGPLASVETLARAFLGCEVVDAVKGAAQSVQTPLVRGDKGPRVDGLQRALVGHGFMLEADRLTGPGTFGPKTEAAVRTFQGAVGLPATGIADAKTLIAMATWRTPEQRVKDGLAADARTSASREKAVRDLGDVGGFGEGLYRKAGAVIDALVPSRGDESRMELAVNAPVAAVPGARVGLRFDGEAEREGGVRLRVQLGAAVSGEVDMVIAEAFAQAELFGWMEASGDDGYEAMRLLSFGLEDRVRSVSGKAADLVWGKGFAKDVRSNMDDDDYVESGIGASVEGGIARKQKQLGGMPVAEAKGALEATTADRLTRDGKESVSSTRMEGSVAVGSWSGKLSLEQTKRAGVVENELHITPQRDVDITDFAMEMGDPARCKETLRGWLFEVLGVAHSVITKQTGLKGNGAQTVGAVFDTVRSIDPAGDFLADQAVLHMATKIKALQAVKMGQRLDIDISWTERKSGWDASLQVDLDQVRSLELGEDERSALYAKLEDITNLLRVGPLKFGPGV
ncbi:MAG: hypothetical protein AMXMBFR64_33920 [Myxococcales bacterium]